MEFWNTVMGRQFFDGTFPMLTRALERIAKALERSQGPQSGGLRSASKHPMRCYRCGGTNVQHAYWVMVNTDEVMDVFGSWNQTDTCYCEDCKDHWPIVEDGCSLMSDEEKKFLGEEPEKEEESEEEDDD